MAPMVIIISAQQALSITISGGYCQIQEDTNAGDDANFFNSWREIFQVSFFQPAG